MTDKRGPRHKGEAETEPAPAPGEARPEIAEDDALTAAVGEAAENRELAQRLQAEFENYRKRILKEQTRAIEIAVEPLVRDLLEVIDEFELALISAEKQPDLDRFLKGVEMVFAKLSGILRSAGVERIDAEGKPFDPEYHEALMQSGDGDGDGEPLVAEVLRSGYTMRGRVIRPSGVRVER